MNDTLKDILEVIVLGIGGGIVAILIAYVIDNLRNH